MKKFGLVLTLGLFISPVTQALESFPGGKAETTSKGKSGYSQFKNGEFVWYAGRELLVKGTYITQGKYLIVTDVSGPRACDSENEKVGVYSWEILDGKTYLTVVYDDCGGRQRGLLAASPYTK